jgi:hypothetical protein
MVSEVHQQLLIDLQQQQAARYLTMKSAGAKMPAAPPPNLGRMSDRELKEYTRRNFSF